MTSSGIGMGLPSLTSTGGGLTGSALGLFVKKTSSVPGLGVDLSSNAVSQTRRSVAGACAGPGALPGEIAQHVAINAHTYVAAVTRGMPVDMSLIPALLATESPYIGLIGSRRRWALTAKALQTEKGLNDAQLARVHAPIGLELQAETPKEIALSIMAEITMLRRGGSGQPMKWMGDDADSGNSLEEAISG